MRRAFVALIVLAGCDAPPERPRSSEENFPTITIGVGEKRLGLPFGLVECDEEPSQTTVRLSGLNDDPRTQRPPLLLLARVNNDTVLDAHVWVPKGALQHAEQLPWVQLVAADVPGGRKPDCRIERTDSNISVICNDATPVPWTEAGPIPDISFKATFACP